MTTRNATTMGEKQMKSPSWVVGMGVTSQCNMNSRFCYSQDRRQEEDLKTERWVSFIKNNAPICVAVRYCSEEIIRWQVEHGAKVNLTCGNFGDAYVQALYGKKKENLPLIEKLGHPVAKFGGEPKQRIITPISILSGTLSRR